MNFLFGWMTARGVILDIADALVDRFAASQSHITKGHDHTDWLSGRGCGLEDDARLK